MELSDYLVILRKRWRSATLVLVGVFLLALAYLNVATPTYAATTRLFFAVPGGESISDLAQGSSFTEKQMSSYAQVATSPLVLGPVAESLGIPGGSKHLEAAVRAAVPTNTVILEITSTSTDPSEAAAVANAVGERLSEVVSSLYPARTDGTQAVLATTLTVASQPESATSPNTRRVLGIALFAGLGLGLAVAVLRDSLDTKIRSSRDVSQISDLAILGSILFDQTADSQPIVMIDNPGGARAEAVRRLRTNLQFVSAPGESRTVLVTSSIAGEGKTTTAINLAVALADAGARVLLIDADLRRPSVGTILGLEGAAGLTSVLIGRVGLDDVIQPWRGARLDVLTSGPVPPNPSELLGSQAMNVVLEQLGRRYEAVVIDCAPLLPVTDAAVLSKKVDGTILVVGAKKTHRAQVRSALDELEAVNADVLGVVLNKVDSKDETRYGSSYSYSYAQSGAA